MTYSPTAFQATHLWQRVCDKLGLTKGLVCTSAGTTQTIVDTNISDDYQDYSDFQNNYAFIRHDAGGAGAAPEGEVQLITDYTTSSKTLGTNAFTVATATGDIVTLVRGSILPLNDLKRLCSLALQELGNVPNPNTSLTTASSQTEYTVPSGVPWNRIIRVQLPRFTDDSNDRRFYNVPFKIVPPTSPGAGDATIEIQQPDDSLTIRLVWVGQHADIFDYDDDISTAIHPSLAVACAALECAKWKSEQFKDLIQPLQQDKENAMQKYPLPKFPKSIFGSLPTWQSDTRYSRYSNEELERA